MNTFKPADYHRYVCEELDICVQKNPIIGYIDRIKNTQYKVHGIIDDEMVDHSICELELVLCHEVLKGNPQTFKEACMLFERLFQLANLVGKGSIPSE